MRDGWGLGVPLRDAIPRGGGGDINEYKKFKVEALVQR